MEKLFVPYELKGEALYHFLKSNKSLLMAQKKYEIKKADAVRLSDLYITPKGEVKKGNNPINDTSLTRLKTTSVINTTNWFDSHQDVHIPGLWKKSLAENRDLYLTEEHKMTFRGIISDEVTAYTKRMTWKSLSIDLPGETEALIFVSDIDKGRNEYMFDQYRLARVKNHSVGMRYVKIDMAINEDSKYYAEEFEVWNKYIDQIANKEAAIENGYFFAVTEAKAIEGAAVPLGSNIVTPTLNNNTKSFDTDEEPGNSTHDPAVTNEEKSMIICPGCTKRFQAAGETNKCPDCGQFVSPGSTSVEAGSMFDSIKAIKETQFI